MARSSSTSLTIEVDPGTEVSALMLRPRGAKACLVLEHGAGAGMNHPAMTAIADGLAALRIASLRFQFPYMEKGGRRPDAPKLCHATIRAAVAAAHQRLPSLPLIAGGKSFGGRMTSQAQADSPLPHVRGLVFVGFPLHPPKTPSVDRAEHLFRITLPMLFFQGTRDALAEPVLIKPLIKKLGRNATLQSIPDADHSFHVPVRSGRTDAEVMLSMLQALDSWIDAIPSAAATKTISPRPRAAVKINRQRRPK